MNRLVYWKSIEERARARKRERLFRSEVTIFGEARFLMKVVVIGIFGLAITFGNRETLPRMSVRILVKMRGNSGERMLGV